MFWDSWVCAAAKLKRIRRAAGMLRSLSIFIDEPP